MIYQFEPKVKSVVGPLGQRMTVDDLPAPDTNRWIARRKAEVVAAVNGGMLTMQDACERYQLSLEEFSSWQRSALRGGIPGLRITKSQHYRDLYE
jgi:hypothetical protein